MTSLSNKAGSSLDLEHYVPFYIRSIANKLARGATRIYTHRFGIGLGEWSCLALLAMEGEVSATRISEVSGFDKAAVSRSVNALRRKQLVGMRSVASHNRKRLISLTDKGRDLHERIARIAKGRELRLLRDLSDAEQALLLRILRTLHESSTAMLIEDDLHSIAAEAIKT